MAEINNLGDDCDDSRKRRRGLVISKFWTWLDENESKLECFYVILRLRARACLAHDILTSKFWGKVDNDNHQDDFCGIFEPESYKIASKL